MTTVNVVQPTYFAIVDRDTLGDGYEFVCAAIQLPPTSGGYGLMMGVRPDMSRVTMIAAVPSFVRQLAEMPSEVRNRYALPEGTFPAAHDGWIDLPDSTIIGRAGRLAVIGPPAANGAHPVTLYENGAATSGGESLPDELHAWKTHLRVSGWVVDDRAAAPADELDECTKPDCERAVPRGTAHCCAPCAHAAEHKYEIHQHSPGCDDRWAVRRPPVAVAAAPAEQPPAQGWAIETELTVAAGGIHVRRDLFGERPPSARHELETILDAEWAYITGPRTAEGWPLTLTGKGRDQLASGDYPRFLQEIVPAWQAIPVWLANIAAGLVHCTADLSVHPDEGTEDPDDARERAEVVAMIEAGRARVLGPRDHVFGWPVMLRPVAEAAAPLYPAPGGEIPGQPGYVVGLCEHRVALSEWRVGFRTCERCPSDGGNR
jgi:hypothetical protein